MKNRHVLYLLLTVAVLSASSVFAGPLGGESVKQEPVFVWGDVNNVYRIPALMTTREGTVLAFCEAREEGDDTGNVDIVLRRSEDGGETWSPVQVVWDEGRNVAGNPCPVQDLETGTIWLLMTWNHRDDPEDKLIAGTSNDSRRPYVCYSNDDGKTWSEPVDIGETGRDPNWGWYATGPGVAIQLKHGEHKGRLICPANHSDLRYGDDSGDFYKAHTIYSDDHGKTWQRSEPIGPGCNESQIVERVDGTLIMNMRSYGENSGYRSVSTSTDGGATWSKALRHEQLTEPTCQASILRYSTAKDGGKNRMLFSNPPNQESRSDLTVRLSYDEGKTWPIAKQLFDGYTAYSSLTVLPNGDIGCLYEAGDDSRGNRGIAALYFARFPLEWLEADPDTSETR